MGSLLIIEAYHHISSGMSGDLFLLKVSSYLLAGMFILFGFFTRLASLLALTALIAFTQLLPADHISIITQKTTVILVFASLTTLLFLGSGKLSLENYFGFK